LKYIIGHDKISNIESRDKMKSKTFKTIALTSIITTVLLGSIGVAAYNVVAKEISFTPTNSNWQVDNVEDAVNDLYDKSNMKTGELFLNFYGNINKLMENNAPTNWAQQYYYNLDFSDIKSFKFGLEYTSTYAGEEFLNITDNKSSTKLLSIISENNINESYSVDVNGSSDVNIRLGIPQVGNLKLKVTSYTKMNGEVVTF